MSLMRIIASPTVWSNDLLPRLGGYLTLEKCLSDVATIGFSTIEESRRLPTNVSELKAKLAGYSLSLACGKASGRLLEIGISQEFSRLMPQLQVLKLLNAPYLIYQEDTVQVYSNARKAMAERPKMSAYELGHFARKLDELAKMVRDQGIELIYRAHLGTLVQSAQEIDILMGKSSQALSLGLDTAHAALNGDAPDALIHAYADRLKYIQLQDLKPQALDEIELKKHAYADVIQGGHFTAAGDGSLDFFKITRALHANNFNGLGVIAALQDPALFDPYAYTKIGYEHVMRCSERCGLVCA